MVFPGWNLTLLSLHHQKVQPVLLTTARAFPSVTSPTRPVLCPHILPPEILNPSFCFTLDSWDGHSSVAPALRKPPLHRRTRCFLCGQNPFQPHLETSHFHISARCTLALPQGPLSALLVTNLLPKTHPADGSSTQTPPSISNTPPRLCCLPWVRRNASQVQDADAVHDRA